LGAGPIAKRYNEFPPGLRMEIRWV
jgi:hypothetical protein